MQVGETNSTVITPQVAATASAEGKARKSVRQVLANTSIASQKISTGVQSGFQQEESDHTASEGTNRPEFMIQVTNKHQNPVDKRNGQTKLSSMEPRKRPSLSPKQKAPVQYTRSPNPLTFGLVAASTTAEGFIVQGRQSTSVNANQVAKTPSISQRTAIYGQNQQQHHQQKKQTSLLTTMTNTSALRSPAAHEWAATALSNSDDTGPNLDILNLMRLQADPIEQTMMNRQPSIEAARVSTAKPHFATPATIFDRPIATSKRVIGTTVPSTTRHTMGAYHRNITTIPNDFVADDQLQCTPSSNATKTRNKKLRPVVGVDPQGVIKQPHHTIVPVSAAVNPFVGPNGTIDLHTVLNARLDNIPGRNFTAGRQQNNGRLHFVSRGGSVQPSMPNGLLSLNPLQNTRNTTAGCSPMNKSIEKRSQSVNRSSYQQFLEPRRGTATTGISSSLMSKIRQGVGLTTPSKMTTPNHYSPSHRRATMVKSKYRNNHQPLTANQSPRIQVDNTADEDSTSQTRDSKETSDSLMQPSYSEQSRQARRLRVGSKRKFDYCPDEDSDNDIFTMQQNCPPGIKPPESKPNDPKQLHTWRQTDKIYENYISRLEQSTSKQKSKDQRGIQKHVEPMKIKDEQQTLSPTLKQNSNSVSFSRTGSNHNTAQERNDQLLQLLKQQSPESTNPTTSRQNRSRTTTAETVLKRPKFSLEFSKWLEKQKEEDPSIVTDMQTLLTPSKNRSASQQGSVDLMAMLVKRQMAEHSVKSRLHAKVPILDFQKYNRSNTFGNNQNNENNAQDNTSETPTTSKLTIPKRATTQCLPDTTSAKNYQRQMQRTPDLASESQRQFQKTHEINKFLSRTPDKTGSQTSRNQQPNSFRAKQKAHLSALEIDSQHSGQKMSKKTVSQDENNRIVSHLTQQKQSHKSISIKSKNLQFQPRQVTVDLQDVDLCDGKDQPNHRKKYSSNNLTQSIASFSPRMNTQHSSDKMSQQSKLKLPVTEQEDKLNKKLYRQDSMLTHFRRLQVFNACKEELDKIKDQKHQMMLGAHHLARRTLSAMLAAYWKEFFRKRKRMHTGQTDAEHLKQSEADAREAVLNRLKNMSSYVDNIEALINLNPITRQKLQDEAVTQVQQPQVDESDETTYTLMRQVILKKLDEATSEIIDLKEKKMAKLNNILDKYGSIEAYKAHIEEKKREYENDRAAFLKKEQERKAQEEAEKKKANMKNSEENKYRVKRWMEDYDKKVFEIKQEEIDLFNEMEKEERLAGLCLIQDDAQEEHQNFLNERENLNNLIGTINQEVKELKKTLKFQKTQKSGKLDMSILKQTPSKKSKKSKPLKTSEKKAIGGGSIASTSIFRQETDLPDASINPSSKDSDFERDSDASIHSSDDDDRPSQARMSKANLASHRMLGRPYLSSSSESSSSSEIISEPLMAKRRSVKKHTSASISKNDSLSKGNKSTESNVTEKNRMILKAKRAKAHKSKRKQLKRQFAIDFTEMENRLYELEEKYEENGLDAILADYDPSKVKKRQELTGTVFNAQSQLTSKLDDIFSKLNPGVDWDEEEKKHNEEVEQERRSLQRRPSIMSRSTIMGQPNLTNRQTKPKAIEIFEETCKYYNEKAPTIFKNVKNGMFEMKEIYLNSNQTYALQEAAKYFQDFADKVKLENNNLFDHDLSEIITSLTMVPALKQLQLVRNDFGDQTLKALKNLLQKRFPNNLDQLTIDSIRLKPQLTSNLMNTLNSSNLRKLQLIQLNMNEDSFNQFLDYVRKCQLEELDLKDSRVTAAQFLQMLEVLRSNKKLKYLNLSYNNLVSQSSHVDSQMKYGNTLETIAEEGGAPGSNPRTQSPATTTRRLSNQQAEVVDNISKFIRRNRNLIHINLEQTGLTYEMIKELLVAIKKSRSLQAIHLCGNPGVNEIALIHDTVSLLNPINFSQWDEVPVISMTRNSKMKRTMNSAMTNRVLSRASQRHLGNNSNLSGNNSRRGSRADIDNVMSPKSSHGSNRSNQYLSPNAGEGANNQKTPKVGGILKQPTMFQDAMAANNAIQGASMANSDSDSEDELDKMRRNAPSAMEQLHQGLGTKQYKSAMKRKPKMSSRLEVYEMERSGRKTVTFQQMKDSVQLLSHKKLILTRFVGHKTTMEHGHRWRLHLQSTRSAACWICDKWNYTLFFWTRSFGEQDQIKMTSDQLQDYEEKKRCMDLYVPEDLPANASGKKTPKTRPSSKINSPNQQSSRNLVLPGQTNRGADHSDFTSAAMKQYEHQSPLLTGSFNQWEEPARMIRVKYFAHFIEKIKVNYLQQLKRQGLIRKEPMKYQELSEQDKAVYQKHLKAYIDEYEPEKWKEIMALHLKYRKPSLINLFTLDTHISSEVWVTAAFVQPGTHTYIVSDQRGSQKQNHHTNIHECTVDTREEEVKAYERITKIKSGDAFNRWKTIFAPWPNENDQMYRQCIENDIKLWKVQRLINKDPDDYTETCKVLLKHSKFLVNLFTYLASKSQFPAIGSMDLGAFCQESNIIDAKFLLSTVDRMFIASTTKSPAVEPFLAQLKKTATKTELIKIQPDNGLVRYQFLETLVRIADQKHKGQTFTPFKGQPEQVTTFARALEILITQNIQVSYSMESPELIRFGRLWKNDVAGIFKANEALLQQLFAKMKKKKNYLSFEDTYKMVEHVEKAESTQQAGLSLKDFNYIYGMSKMLIPEEVAKCNQYVRTKFLEMVEMIGRLTIFKNYNTQMEDLPMYKQIQLCLDEIFVRHLGVLCFDLGVGDGSDVSSGESEDDY